MSKVFLPFIDEIKIVKKYFVWFVRFEDVGGGHCLALLKKNCINREPIFKVLLSDTETIVKDSYKISLA